jgi:hypothetical protein
MPANTSPIFSGVGDIQWTTVQTAANTTFDGTLGTPAIAFSASVSGGFVQRLRFRASGSATATVARIFINNGQSTGSAVNNVLFDEITLAGTTVSQTAAQAVYELPMNIALPAGYRILTTLGTVQSAGGGWYASTIAGSYATI